MPITTPIMQIKQKDQMNNEQQSRLSDAILILLLGIDAFLDENIIMQTLTTKMLIKNLHVCNLWFQGLVYLRIS